jgi:hypothetical protein
VTNIWFLHTTICREEIKPLLMLGLTNFGSEQNSFLPQTLLEGRGMCDVCVASLGWTPPSYFTALTNNSFY